MSIYCYINEQFNILSSKNLININSVEEFEKYIKQQLNLDTNINLYCYYCYSTLQLEYILKLDNKITNNYLVTTEKDSNFINFLNLSTLYNSCYMVPKKITFNIFSKIFYNNNEKMIIYNKNISLEKLDTFNSNTLYYYKLL
jgi:hypothetical protein